MLTNFAKSDKNKSLQAYKDKLLTEIFYYSKRIEEAGGNVNKSRSFEDDTSSDSDSSELTPLLVTGPPISQLNAQRGMLKTCLQATQELTNLEVLQSEVTVLTEAPQFEGESLVTEPGTWREVTAECCVDLVPFSITFYAHSGEGKFAPISYRGLKVTFLKASHGAELVKSVMPGLRRPSDAVEVVRSYAIAHRSRRSTLARLADRYGAALSMNAIETGGYILKCANLEVSWMLQNKWSPIAPFHHRLKFDIDYMDEDYLKTIMQAHRQLSDPAVDTDERTLLLAKIINTCLEAKPLEQESSDQEPSPVKNVENRRTTLDREPDFPNMKKKKDSEVMAPPKSLPKKIRPKTKSPSKKTDDPKSTKRTMQDDNSKDSAKKPKMNDNIREFPKNEISKETAPPNKRLKSAVSDKGNIRNIATTENKEDKVATDHQSQGDHHHVVKGKVFDVNKDVNGKTQNTGGAKKTEKSKVVNKNTENDKNTESIDKNVENKKVKSTTKNDENADKNVETTAFTKDAAAKNDNTKNTVTKNATVKTKSIIGAKRTESKSAKKAEHKNDNTNKKMVKSSKMLETEGNVRKIVNTITNEKGDVVKKVVKKLANAKPKVAEQVSDDRKSTKNTVDTSESDKKGATTDANKTKKPLNELNSKMTKTSNQNIVKNTKIIPKNAAFSANLGNIKKTTTDTIEKENSMQNKIKSTKIPQKKIHSPKGVIKKIPIRVSPRISLTKSKPSLAGVNMKKIIQKPITGIPRLLTKPKPKVT